MSEYAKLAFRALEAAARADDLRAALDIAIFLTPQESSDV